ncbi:MAG TPA: glycosyltransferase family 87 protein [Myxococcaceae bacterium]|nr:glycosyltransferase family 87 protein [Myxococcaceae bacterium]
MSRLRVRGEHLRRAVWPLFLLLGVLLALNPRRGIDFTVFRTAGERWLAGTSLYRAEDGPMPFKYAPPVAVLFAFLALVPRGLGAVLWNAASVLLLLLAVIQLPRVDPAPERADGTWAALALAGPIGTVLFYGQVDLLLLGLLVLAAAAAGTRGDGGTALGLSVLTKPPAVLATLFFLGRRRWRALAVAAGVVLLVTAAFALRVGVVAFGQEIAAWRALVERSTLEWVTGPNPQGFPTLILDVAGWLGTRPTPETLALAQLSAVLFLGALVLALREDPGASFRLTCLSIAMCSPLAWRANFVLALPAVRRVVAAARWGDGFSRLVLGLVVLASVLTSGVLLDRNATERLLAFRPWGLLGLLLVVVEFSAPRLPPAVRGSASSG